MILHSTVTISNCIFNSINLSLITLVHRSRCICISKCVSSNSCSYCFLNCLSFATAEALPETVEQLIIQLVHTLTHTHWHTCVCGSGMRPQYSHLECCCVFVHVACAEVHTNLHRLEPCNSSGTPCFPPLLSSLSLSLLCCKPPSLPITLTLLATLCLHAYITHL